MLFRSLQPMARQSAKTVEANIHMLADRMMTIAGDPRMDASGSGAGETAAAPQEAAESRQEVLNEAAEIYEFHTIALYGLDGRLIQGIDGAEGSLDSSFFALLKDTDNLTTYSSTIFQGKLGITMGMPVKKDGETVMYVVGVYRIGRAHV